MAEFKDAKLWMKLAFLMTMLGLTLELFALASGMGGISDSAVEACIVIGFLGFALAATLALCLVFLDEVNGNRIAQICFIVAAFVAGIGTIIGVAIWGGKFETSDPPPYSTTMGVMACFLAILGAIFGILDLVGVGGGGK